MVNTQQMNNTCGDPPSEVLTKYLGFYVRCLWSTELVNNFSCNARVKLTLVAQSPNGQNMSKGFERKFTFEHRNGRGCTRFITFTDLLNDEKGFIKDNTIVVEAMISTDRPYGVIMRSNEGNIFGTIQRKCVDLNPELIYFMNDSECNVVFKVEGKRIPALKELLIYRSNYFRSMFSGNYTESKGKEIEIQDTTHEAFKTIIWYLYSYELAIDSEEMLIDLDFQYEVYRLADRFQIKRLLIYFENQLKANITEENLELAFIDKTFDKLILEDKDYVKKINGFTDDYMFDKTIESSRKKMRIGNDVSVYSSDGQMLGYGGVSNASPLSNFYKTSFTYSGHHFEYSECAIMYEKAITFGDQMIPLSNFYKTSFTYSGHHFEYSECAIMYEKAITFGDQISADKVLKCRTPWMAKRLGREVKPFDPKKWVEARDQRVPQILYAKFTQNATLKEWLLSTGSAVLAEIAVQDIAGHITYEDPIWGICIGAYHKDIDRPSEWHKYGENFLGKTLVSVRQTIANEIMRSGNDVSVYSSDGQMLGYGGFSNASPLSNFYKTSFAYSGHHFEYSECAIMHKKAITFGDQMSADKVLKCRSPWMAKRLGREVKPFDPKKWVEARDERLLLNMKGQTLNTNEKTMDVIGGHTEDVRGRSEATIRFVVNDVNQLTGYQFSAVTHIRHLPWQIMVNTEQVNTTCGDPPLEVITKCLGCYIRCPWFTHLVSNCSCNVRVKLTLVAQSPNGRNISKSFEQKFPVESKNSLGFPQFIAFQNLLNDEKGFIKDNTIVVEAKVSADRPYGVIMRSNEGNIFGTIQRKCVDLNPELIYFMNESECNVMFKVEGKRIPALKELLIYRSDYFRSMFSGNYTESKDKEIEIQDTTHEAFKTIIWYLYSYELAIDSEDMLIDLDFQYEVYRLADRFQIKRLLSYFENQLKTNITEENLELKFIDKTFDKLILEDKDYVKKINGFTDDYIFDKTIESSRKKVRIV
ncbi:unnamed protein product, partial [Medioppia subpectinata]